MTYFNLNIKMNYYHSTILYFFMIILVVFIPGSLTSVGYPTSSLKINDCFERVSIGKRLNASDVSRSISTTSLKQCDAQCERSMCNAYVFGIGPKGNGTCELSKDLPRSPPNDDPDYDLFIRLLQCRNMIMCFKQHVNGRRLIGRYIKRTFPCDSLARCQLACTIEREFICEGFNYRYASDNDVGNSCQLTAMPANNLDLTLDFTSDTDYDFYTRDRNAPAACGHLSYRTWNPQSYHNDRQIPLNDGVYYTSSTPDWWQQPNNVFLPRDDYVNSVKLPHPNYEDNSLALAHKQIGYECFVRARTGFRLDRRLIVLTLNAATLYDCELVCANEKKFTCNIIAYRYSSSPPTDNCHLGEKNIRHLDLYYDIIPDRDYDVYIKNEYSRPNCQPSRTWDSDCFERIRSGIRLHNSMIKFAVVTDSLIECELICLHIRHFTCRAFSYRYGIPSRDPKNTYNCLLSDHPIPEMDPGKHLIEESNCELYHRGSYGHGCEIDQWPYYPNPPGGPAIHAHIPSPTPYPSHHFPTSPPVIYPQQNPYPGGVIRTNMTDRPYTNNYLPTLPRTHPTYTPIIYHAVLPPENPKFPHNTYHGQIPHTKPHHPYNPYNSHYPYDHKPIRPPSVPNYHTQFYDPNLSKIPHFGRNDKICYTAYGTPARLTTSSIRNSIMVVSEQECKAECSKSRETSNFRCTTISYWLGHCELSDVEMRDLKPGIDFKEDESYWLFSWDFTDSRCFVPTTVTAKKPLDGPVFYPDGIWSTYTVSGRPCKAGTRCSVMPEVGVWSCPVEYGDWDYCCRPDHHCGYSEGYNYPWCYVGSKSREQWRPCSNLYYPYSQSQDKALHWPISYLHKISPPNNTYGYQTSLTDHFFSSVPKENTRRTEQFNTSSVVVSTSTSSNTTLLPIPSNATFSKLVEFQVVDVTENSKVTGNSIGEPWNWKMNVNISNKINNEVKWNESKLEANNNNNNNKNGITSLLNMRKRWSG